MITVHYVCVCVVHVHVRFVCVCVRVCVHVCVRACVRVCVHVSLHYSEYVCAGLFLVATTESPSQAYRSLGDAICEVCTESLTTSSAVKLKCGHNFCEDCMKG